MALNSARLPAKSPYQSSNSSDDSGGRSAYLIFLSMVLLAAVCGLGFRLYVSPERVTAALREALARSLKGQANSVQVSFSSAQVLLAHGSFPDLALEVNDVELRAPAVCDGHLPALQIPRIRIPVRFFALLQGQILPGKATGETLQIPLSTLNHECAVSGKESQGKTTSSRVELRDFSILVEPPFQSAKLRGSLIIPAELVQNEVIPPLKLNANLAQDVSDLNLQGYLNEGSMQAMAHYQAHDPQHQGAPYIDVSVETHSLPVSALAGYLQKAKIIEDRFQPHFIWLNCQAKMAGRAENFLKDSALQIQNCVLTGETGEISLKDATLDSNGVWQPFVVDVKKLNVRKVLDTFSLQGPNGVFSDFGFLNGQIKVDGAKNVHALGELSQVKIAFMNRGMNEEQTIEKLALKLDFHENRVLGVIPSIKIQDGVFNGTADMDFDSHFRDGEVKIAVEQLKFSPAVEQLMLDGTAEQMGVHGTAHFHEGRLINWKGIASAHKIQTPEVQIPGVDAQMDFKDGVFSLQAQARELSVAQNWFWFQFAKPIFLGESLPSEWMNLRDARTRLEVQDGEVRWNKSRASLPDAHFTLESNGTRHLNQALEGTLETQLSNSNRRVANLQWQLSGSTERPILQPISPEIKEILKRASEAAEANTQPTVPSRLKSLGQKMLDRAEKIMRLQKKAQLGDGVSPESAKSVRPAQTESPSEPTADAAQE